MLRRIFSVQLLVIPPIALHSVHRRLQVSFLINVFWIDGLKFLTLRNLSTKRWLLLSLPFDPLHLWLTRCNRGWTSQYGGAQVCLAMHTFEFSTLFLRLASILCRNVHVPTKSSNTWNIVVLIRYRNKVNNRGHYLY